MFINRIIKLLPLKERKGAFYSSFLSVVQAVLNLAGITALLPIMILVLDPDKLKEYPSFAQHQTLVLISIVVFIILKNVLNVWISNIKTRYINKLYTYYSEQLYDYYFSKGLLFVKDQHSDKLAYNVNAVSFLFTHGMVSLSLSMLSETVLLIFIWSAILCFSPLIAFIIVLCLVPFVLIYFYWFRTKLTTYGKIENEAKRHIMTVVGDTFRGYSDVKLNNAYQWFKNRLDVDVATISNSREWINRTLLISSGIIECYVIIGMILFVIIGGNDNDTRITLGMLAIATLRMLPSFRSLIAMATQWKNNSFCLDIIQEAIENESTNDTVSEPICFRKQIEINKISYQYPDTDSFVFEDFSLTIPKGSSLGIRGISGIGKTTLINLLLGFYTPQKGTIRVDDQFINKDNSTMWHKLIAYVPQQVFIMDTTLAENIAFGTENPDKARIDMAIEQSGLSDYVNNLKNGINTRIGQNGNFLSGGEAQRIGIARALYKKTEVLFLDEITSSLDSRTENEIMNTIQNLSKNGNLTCVIISHKESTLSFCDRILDL